MATKVIPLVAHRPQTRPEDVRRAFHGDRQWDAEAELAAAEQQRQFRPFIYWYVSFRCNLACRHCSVQSSPAVDTSQDLDTAAALRVVEQMHELGVGTVAMTGGEALLRPDAIELIEAVTERGMAVSLESNGLLFDARFVAVARRAQADGRLSIGISLDGGTPDTHDEMRGKGTFARTLQGLRLLKEHGVDFRVQMVLSRANYHTIPEYYAVARELQPQLKRVLFATLNPVGRGASLTSQLGLRAQDIRAALALIKREKGGYLGTTTLKAPPAAIPSEYLGMLFNDASMEKQWTCQFPLLGVLPNGDITVCALTSDNEHLRLGNIRSHTLKQVWDETHLTMLRSRYVAATDLQGICGDCIWKASCKGGCRAWAYEDGGSFDAPLPLCEQMVKMGEFPDAYRISRQKEALSRVTLPAAPGCSACSL